LWPGGRERKEKFIAISEKDNHQREKMCEVREKQLGRHQFAKREIITQ